MEFKHHWLYNGFLPTGTKPRREPMMIYCKLDLREQFQWKPNQNTTLFQYNAVMMSTMASQITSLTIVYPTVYSDADQRKHQSSGSLAFVRGIHWWPLNSTHKRPVMWKMFPFDDIIMHSSNSIWKCQQYGSHYVQASMTMCWCDNQHWFI